MKDIENVLEELSNLAKSSAEVQKSSRLSRREASA